VVFILILLLIAAIFGVLGAVLKAALVIVLAIVLAFAILVGGTFWYVRHRLNRFVRGMEHDRRGYPTTGRKRPGPGLPPE
jgi:cell division protein FtsW (lipid II flippase)